MKSKYLMGADVGTQSAKVLIFTLEGEIVCQGCHPLKKLAIPAPLLAEHPEDDIWDALTKAFRQAMKQFVNELNLDPVDIQAMGLCVIRCCRALLKKDGSLAYPVINWMDKRLNSPYCHIPAYGEVGYVTTSSGYISHRLTGEFKDTCANYIGAWPIDDRTFDWKTDTKALEDCGVTADMLFDLVKPGDVLGHVTKEASDVTGLPQGLPVVATAHDKAVEALGAGSLDAGTVLISLGTYIGAMVHGEQYVADANHFWTFQASMPDKYLYECMGVRRGMWTVSWFCDQFGDGVTKEAAQKSVSVEDMFNAEGEAVPPGCEGLITIHDWAPPAEAVFRKGVMFGFDGRHTRGHMYRSILEGIAFTLKNHVDKMMKELGTPVKKLIVSGGGANSDLFMGIFADVFGVPAFRNRIKGSASVGCVINAGMAVNAFTSYETAVDKMVVPDDRFEANLNNTKIYDRINREVYQQVNPYFDPILEKLSAIVDE
ncbi:MAG: sugar kinase [Desulfobacterales bacterium]|nr:sugar kinase [Desulfobacterales bacterium]